MLEPTRIMASGIFFVFLKPKKEVRAFIFEGPGSFFASNGDAGVSAMETAVSALGSTFVSSLPPSGMGAGVAFGEESGDFPALKARFGVGLTALFAFGGESGSPVFLTALVVGGFVGESNFIAVGLLFLVLFAGTPLGDTTREGDLIELFPFALGEVAAAAFGDHGFTGGGSLGFPPLFGLPVVGSLRKRGGDLSLAFGGIIVIKGFCAAGRGVVEALLGDFGDDAEDPDAFFLVPLAKEDGLMAAFFGDTEETLVLASPGDVVAAE
mmetsp:Transcript_45628/g.89941  ORF Transcript_45628/g.89941 Transcript_45628/m.89941 type:complete len:267 (+) Transcript_45628:47-847(+)